MARVTIQQTNFTGGEQSPRLAGRTDIDSYGNAVALMENAHPVVHGGAVRRPGTFYKAPAAATNARGSILVPFVEGRDRAWLIEFSNNELRVRDSTGAVIAGPFTTVYSDSMLDLIDWAQQDSTMWVFHPFAPVQRLQRFGTNWTLSDAPFTQLPFAEIGILPPVTGTLTSAAIGSRTLDVSAAFFLAADVGRGVLQGPGVGVITAVASALTATVQVNRAFASVFLNTWELEGSPQTACTPSAKDPVGASITLSLTVAGWRASDVGSMVRINGGLCRILQYTDPQNVTARIVRVLNSTTAAPALAWSLEPPVWGPGRGYPRTGTVYQQRLICAGTTKQPRTVWGSRIGEPLDFELGTDDDLAFAWTIDSDEASAISYVASNTDLMVLTESAEYSLRPGTDKALTPTNVKVRPEGNAGAAQVRPVTVGAETLFVQRAGRKVRSLNFSYQDDRYDRGDITKRAEHITLGGVRALSYQQEPDGIVWAVRGDGALLSCTLDRGESVLAWARHYTEGAVESVCSIPAGDYDATWLIVRRVINGLQVRWLEMMDTRWQPRVPAVVPANTWPPVEPGVTYGCQADAAATFDADPPRTTFNVPHLTGETVDILADGAVQAQQVVPASGVVTLERPATRVLIGLPYRTRIVPLTPELGTGAGTAQGNSMRTGEVTLRILNSVGGKVQGDGGQVQVLPSRSFGEDALDNPPESRTDLVRVEMLGWDRGKASFQIIQDQPLPLHVLAIIRKHTVND